MASTILIVDKEPMLTDLLSEHFKQNGYLTYTANTAPRPWSSYATNPT